MLNKNSWFILVCKTFLNLVVPGLILCICYPQIHSLFLTAAKDGYIPYYLTIWESIAITWIGMTIFRTQQITSNYYQVIQKFEDKDKEDGSSTVS